MDRAYLPQTLMGFGAGLLRGAGPSRAPVGLGSALGLGLLGAEQAMQRAQNFGLQQRQENRAQGLYELQKQQLEQQQRQQELQQQLWQNMGNPALSQFGQAFPEQAAGVLSKGIQQQMQPTMPLSPEGKQAFDVQQGFIPPSTGPAPLYTGEGMGAQEGNLLNDVAQMIAEGRSAEVTPQRMREYLRLRGEMAAGQQFQDNQGRIVSITPDVSMLPLPGQTPAQGPQAPTLAPPTPPAQTIGGAQLRPARTAQAGPQPTVQTLPGGQTVTTTPPQRLSPTEQTEFRKASNVLSELRQSYEAYRNSLATEGSAFFPGEARDKQQSQYRDLQLKMKEAYNLGVLNGPDLALMEQVINPPGTLFREGRELFGGGDTAGGLLPQLDASVESLLQGKEQMIKETYGQPAIGRGGVTIGNRTFAEEDIQDTGRQRGMSRAQVIEALEERYGGSAR